MVPAAPTLDTGAVTVSAFLRANGSPGGWRAIVSKGLVNCLASSWMLKTDGSGGLTFGIWDGASFAFSPSPGAASVWDGRWHHAAGTFDGSTVRLYLDGALVGATGAAKTIRYGLADGDDLVIGDAANDCGQVTQFAGAVDEVGVWGRALSQTEIQSLLPPAEVGLTLTASPDSVVSGEGLVTLLATIDSAEASGDVEFWDTSAAPVLLGVAPLSSAAASTSVAALRIRLYGAGPHQIEARYGGDLAHAPATSSAASVSVAADMGVTATGVTVQRPTFYPAKDGYLDTVAIRGTPGEPVSVAIRVYNNATGKLVRTWSLPSRAVAWSINWDGRSGTGTVVSAGTYRVSQVLRDGVGHTKTFTSYTTVSSKRLHWYTGSQTRYGSQYSAAGATPYAFVDRHSCDWYGCLNLYGNLFDEYAYARYMFTLPRAVRYKSLTFSVQGREHWPTVYIGPATISLYNFAKASEDGVRNTGITYGWYSTSVAASGHVSSTRGVRAYVRAYGFNYGDWDIARVRLTYVYAVLE